MGCLEACSFAVASETYTARGAANASNGAWPYYVMVAGCRVRVGVRVRIRIGVWVRVSVSIRVRVRESHQDRSRWCH